MRGGSRKEGGAKRALRRGTSTGARSPKGAGGGGALEGNGEGSSGPPRDRGRQTAAGPAVHSPEGSGPEEDVGDALPN